jgi:hypothetical protein
MTYGEFRSLKIGDRIRTTEEAWKELRGEPGTVIYVDSSEVRVRLDIASSPGEFWGIKKNGAKDYWVVNEYSRHCVELISKSWSYERDY